MKLSPKLSTSVEALVNHLHSEPLSPIWISLVPKDTVVKRAREIEVRPELPLAGMTFAVKDNFDVAGMITTAGCPAYAYKAEITATVVRRLQEAGALLIGLQRTDWSETDPRPSQHPRGCSRLP